MRTTIGLAALVSLTPKLGLMSSQVPSLECHRQPGDGRPALVLTFDTQELVASGVLSSTVMTLRSLTLRADQSDGGKLVLDMRPALERLDRFLADDR
jgi:hypothetical protein